MRTNEHYFSVYTLLFCFEFSGVLFNVDGSIMTRQSCCYTRVCVKRKKCEKVKALMCLPAEGKRDVLGFFVLGWQLYNKDLMGNLSGRGRAIITILCLHDKTVKPNKKPHHYISHKSEGHIVRREVGFLKNKSYYLFFLTMNDVRMTFVPGWIPMGNV